MTVIKNIRLKNFKSFRKADIPFSSGFTAIAGPNASGKCVVGETKVLLPNGESRQIADIVEEKLKTAKTKQFLEDGVVGFNDDTNFKVLSLNPITLKTEQRTVRAVVQRLAPQRLLKVRTRMGKEVITTDYHPFFSINEKGLYSMEAKDLKEGQCIATPSQQVLEGVLKKNSNVLQMQKYKTAEKIIQNTDIVMDEIVEIEELKNIPEYVYDLSVDFSHNFIANNIFVHNSNVLDALLFAMGITSLRLLRASKLTELVNHDATEGYAKVELTLQDNNGKDLLVTRMVDRNGKSIYKIDEKRKTLNEIQSLLLELGVDPNGHNIVVQGDITRVIEMNAKQRRQVIEEVAGLSEFEEKKEEAIKKLEKVEQRVKDAQLILNEREAYLSQLEADRNNALKFNLLQSEMRQSKATILSEEIKIIRKELDSAKGAMERMQKDIEDKKSQRSALQQEEQELERKVEDATRKLIDASEKTYSSVGKEVEQKKGHLNLLEERLRSKNDSLSSKASRILALKTESELLEKSSEEKKKQLAEVKKELKELEKSLEQISRQIDSQSPEFENSESGIRSHESEVSQILIEIALQKDKLHELNIKKHGIEKDAKNALHTREDLERAKRKLEERLSRKNEIEKQIALLEKKNPAKNLAKTESEIEEILSTVHSLHGKKSALEDSVKAIGSAKSDCPTCEKPLEQKIKERLLEKKQKEIADISQKISKLEEHKKQSLLEKVELSKDERALSHLKYSLGEYRGLDEEMQSAQKKLAQNSAASSSGSAEIEKEVQKIIAKIEGLEGKKKELDGKIEDLHQSSQNREMNELLLRMQQVNKEKGEKEAVSGRLSIELEQVLTARIESIEKESKVLEREKEEFEKSIGEIEKEKLQTEETLGKVQEELEKANRANKLLEEEKTRITAKIGSISQKRDELSTKIEAREKELNETNLEQSKNEVRIVDLEEEFKDYSTIEVLKEFNLNDLHKRIPNIEKEIEELGAINMKSLENFDVFKKEVDDVRLKATKLDEERRAVVEMIEKIDVRKLSVFMECFSHVAKKFSELYFNFFEGEGLLDLSDKINPLEGGLLIQAKYKEDTLKSIDAMSGGEKSLTALAFLFAIQSFEPAPFYIFDEVDAALDKENSVKVGKMIRGQSSTSQFITISHNDSVINQADQIVGVAMNKHKSSVIGLRLKKGNAIQNVQQAQEDVEAQDSGEE